MTNIIKMCLAALLFFVPFQRYISIISGYKGSHFINYIDEIAIVVFAPLALFKLYKDNRLSNQFNLALLIPMSIFVVVELIGGSINGNRLNITALGIFDYMKNFIVIIIYFAFFSGVDDFKKIFRLLLAIGVIIGVISFIQEAWALLNVYIFKKDIGDPSNYLFNYLNINLIKGYWRFGMFRSPSLMVSSITSGLYCLLIMNIYLWITKKVNYSLIACLFSGIFTSISRISYTGFLLVAGLQLFKNKKWVVILLVPVAILVFFMSGYRDLNFVEMIDNEELSQPIEAFSNYGQREIGEIDEDSHIISSTTPEKHYRELSREKALEIWKDHPLWGVGPGMFGGVVSLMFNSYIFSEYNFRQINYLRLLTSIDNFWLQLMAEAGLAGVLAFIGLLFTIVLMLVYLKKWTSSDELKGLASGLMVYMIVILIHTLGLGLNTPSVLYTYCALIGIGFAGIKNA